MDNQEHACHLGGLVGNLQTLEIALRFSLAHRPGSVAEESYGDEFRNAAVGTRVPLTDLSNYASLSELIKAFNKAFAPANHLDIELVNLWMHWPTVVCSPAQAKKNSGSSNSPSPTRVRQKLTSFTAPSWTRLGSTKARHGCAQR